jgi:hypothetical protein
VFCAFGFIFFPRACHVFLSDGTLEDRTPDVPSDNLVYKNFSWTNAKYQTPKLYIDNNLIDSKHYTRYNTSGRLSFNSSLPSISSYTFDQVKIKYFGVLENTNLSM